MGDLSIEYPKIKKLVGERHRAYVKKFGRTISIVGGEQDLNRTRILAKLRLLSKVFVEGSVIDEAEELVVSSREGTYPMSIRMVKKGNPICIYLLNTGKDVVVSDSVGLAMTIGTMETRILLVTDTKRVCRRFSSVLEKDFDWTAMATSLLSSIHETIYDSHEVLRKEFLGDMDVDDPSGKPKA